MMAENFRPEEGDSGKGGGISAYCEATRESTYRLCAGLLIPRPGTLAH